MKEIEQYKAFIESVCNIYGIVDAIQPLQKGLDAMMEATLGMENIGAYDVDDKFLNQMSTDEYESSNADPQAAKQLWDVFDEEFASANGVDAAYQKALDDLAAQGVDTSILPQDNSEYIAAFGTSIESDESEQPWMCEACALTEAHRDRTTGGNWFGKTLRDQNNYDEKVRNKNDRELYVPTAEMSEDLFNEVSTDGDPAWAEQYANYWKRNSPLDNKADKTKTMNVTAKYDITKPVSAGKGWNQYDLGNDGFKSTGENSVMSKTGRRIIKRGQQRLDEKDMQDQLADMMVTEPEDDGTDYESAIRELCDRWCTTQSENGNMVSDNDFRKYINSILANKI